MDNLTRSEVSTILNGLQFVRANIRKELFVEGVAEGGLWNDPEYRNVVDLQTKIMTYYDKIAY
jgi:hypothetical protein